MNYAIILSGGIGTRMQMGDFPKQYLEVEKKPILLYTLEQFQKSSAVEKIVIVAADAWREKIRGWMEEDGITKFLAFADAGIRGRNPFIMALPSAWRIPYRRTTV